LIDSTGSNFLHGNGILVQNAVGTRAFGPVTVKGNTVIGGELAPNLAGNIAVGIYVTSGTQDVTVTDNVVRRVAHSGIRLESSTRNYVANNRLVSTGTGGIYAFEVLNTTDSKILNNIVSVDPNSPLGSSVILERGNSRNNTYTGNTDGRNPIAASRQN
jgi:parallel beta-helix repeat protein